MEIYLSIISSKRKIDSCGLVYRTDQSIRDELVTLLLHCDETDMSSLTSILLVLILNMACEGFIALGLMVNRAVTSAAKNHHALLAPLLFYCIQSMF